MSEKPPPYDQSGSEEHERDCSSRCVGQREEHRLDTDGHYILNQSGTSRARQVREVVDGLVFPVLEARAQHGLSRTTIALIPSDMAQPGRSPDL